jgi:uncharacterized DUF497 family protein
MRMSASKTNPKISKRSMPFKELSSVTPCQRWWEITATFEERKRGNKTTARSMVVGHIESHPISQVHLSWPSVHPGWVEQWSGVDHMHGVYRKGGGFTTSMRVQITRR